MDGREQPSAPRSRRTEPKPFVRATPVLASSVDVGQTEPGDIIIHYHSAAVCALMPHRVRRARPDPPSVGARLLTTADGASSHIETQTSQTAPESNDRVSRYSE